MILAVYIKKISLYYSFFHFKVLYAFALMMSSFCMLNNAYFIENYDACISSIYTNIFIFIIIAGIVSSMLTPMSVFKNITLINNIAYVLISIVNSIYGANASCKGLYIADNTIYLSKIFSISYIPFILNIWYMI